MTKTKQFLTVSHTSIFYSETAVFILASLIDFKQFEQCQFMHLLALTLIMSFLFAADEEAVRPEEEVAGDLRRGGRAGHGRPDKGVVSAAGPTDLPHRLW